MVRGENSTPLFLGGAPPHPVSWSHSGLATNLKDGGCGLSPALRGGQSISKNLSSRCIVDKGLVVGGADQWKGGEGEGGQVRVIKVGIKGRGDGGAQRAGDPTQPAAPPPTQTLGGGGHRPGRGPFPIRTPKLLSAERNEGHSAGPRSCTSVGDTGWRWHMRTTSFFSKRCYGGCA